MGDLNTTYSEVIKHVLHNNTTTEDELLASFIANRAVEQPYYGILIVLYAILSLLGALGNSLVILSVVRKPAMRTPRNMFIVNLAISDLLLCTLTMPFTLMEILTKFFPLGNYSIICKMVGMLQATSIFVSTISIIAIALDRYQVIIYPTRQSLQLVGASLIILLIWIIAIILALPLFIYKEISHNEIQINETKLHINFCYESWPHGRFYYTVFSFIVQYVIPIIIVSAAYIRILYKLRYRFVAGFVAQDEGQNNRQQARGRRLQRTNMLLISIAVIFFMSWLPLNLFNLIADIEEDKFFSTQPMIIVYAFCHMMGMSSAIWNPILYGWLNDNFWREFQDIMCMSSSKNAERTGSKRSSFKKTITKSHNPQKNDYTRATTASTEMSLLTKC